MIFGDKKLRCGRQSYGAWIVLALLIVGLGVSACGDAGAERVEAQPLTLATPVAVGAEGTTGLALPQQIVVVLVTPTAAQGASEQQGQGQQSQDQQTQGQQEQSQSSEGQAVAQAQGTPQATPQEQQGGESGGGSGGGGEQQQESGDSGGNSGGSQVNEQELISMGEQIYTDNCASCHQPNGEGTSDYPPLAGSGVLTEEDPTSVIQTVVNGRGQMPAFGEQLSADEIAAVISYERNSWGNSAGVVTAEQVSQVQEGGSAQPTGSEQQQSEQQQGEQTQGQQPQEQQPQDQQSGAAQATPAPEGGEQAQDTGEGQTTPTAGEGQVSVTQEQSGNVITIRIEVVVITPEASGGAQPAQTPATQETPAPEAGQPEVTPTPVGSEAQATPSPEAGESTSTPVPEGGEAQATPTGEATPQGEASGGGSGEAQATPAGQQGSGEATATPEGETPEAAASGDSEILARGEAIYGTTCANCHQLSGEGNTAYPPLTNSEIVTAEDPTAALLTILNGRGHMPSFGGVLSDEEIAAVLSHERNAWDNNASMVTVEQVQQARGNQSSGQSGEQGSSQEQNSQEQSSQEQSSGQSEGSQGENNQGESSEQNSEQSEGATNEAPAEPTAESQSSSQSGAQSQGATSEATVQGGTGQGSGEVVIQLEIVVVAPEAASGEQQPAATSSPEAAAPQEGATEESAPAEEGATQEGTGEQSGAQAATAAPVVVTVGEEANAVMRTNLLQLVAAGQEFLTSPCEVCQQAVQILNVPVVAATIAYFQDNWSDQLAHSK